MHFIILYFQLMASGLLGHLGPFALIVVEREVRSEPGLATVLGPKMAANLVLEVRCRRDPAPPSVQVRH